MHRYVLHVFLGGTVFHVLRMYVKKITVMDHMLSGF